jgi:hypothetical protein
MTDRNDTVTESPAERYAFGRMAESEELAFETRMLEEPRLADEVDVINRMRQGFRILERRGELARFRRRGFVGWPSALAAMLALVVIGGALLMLNARSTNNGASAVLASSPADLGIKASGKPMAMTTIVVGHTRGQEVATEVTRSPRSGVIALRILPAVAADSGVYRATLQRLTDKAPQAIAANVEAVADPSGFVTLYMDATRLMPGLYRLSLAQATRTEEFLLKVIR